MTLRTLARIGEDGFGDERPAQQAAHLDPQQGDDGNQGVAEGMAVVHFPRREPLGVRRTDIVIAEHVEHARPHEAGDPRHRIRSQGHGRHDQVEGRCLAPK